MKIITKITTQKHSTERFNIYLDDRYAFSVDQDVFIKYELKKGKQLDEEDIIEIQYGDDIKKAFNKALEFLSYRMRSIKEVSDHLKLKEFPEPIIAEVIYRLKDYRYVDDLEFAKAYVRSQWKTNGKGPNVMKQELKAKGIEQIILEAALLEYDESFQFEEALKHAHKAVNKNKNLSSILLKQKVEQYLMRKGFSSNIISNAISEVKFEKEEAEEWEALVKQADKAKSRYKNNDQYTYTMKMKQFLYRKGFSMELIERYLEMDEL
ncbi:recombination regulator RecX [Metabacillus fastidiosus]|uniref:recombination regulator RecX n=1 Tax=Metabacillus fastidiosus TaxID=1458 RepID=UPI003D2DD3A0